LDTKPKVSFFWFRRDLRLDDNSGLYHSLKDKFPVIPIFIFDANILDKLENKEDKRLEFIHKNLFELNQKLLKLGSSLLVKFGKPLEVWKELSKDFNIASVYTNHDYEPYAIERDNLVKDFLLSKKINFYTYKDQVIFEKDEILKNDGKPYTIYTPYSKLWKIKLDENALKEYRTENLFNNFHKTKPIDLISLEDIGFKKTFFDFKNLNFDLEIIKNYDKQRDYFSKESTTKISVYLRFGIISIRKLVKIALELNDIWLNELIWREFFMMILYKFPYVADKPFRLEYEKIKWVNDENNFQKWKEGNTGFPIVDAAMHELNQTGYIHNRLRMLTASFLVKNLLIDWKWGEKYFAKKLLDFELSSNNGNWQWVAGTGCDSSPYFRVFNPEIQTKKFDPELKYIKKWIPNFDSQKYQKQIIDLSFSRERAISIYKQAKKEF